MPEKEKEANVVSIDPAEVAHLRDEVNTLHKTIADQEETIKALQIRIGKLSRLYNIAVELYLQDNNQ